MLLSVYKNILFDGVKKMVVKFRVLMVLISLCCLSVQAGEQPLRFGGEYKGVNLDEFITEQQPVSQGSKVILNPAHIKTIARLKSYPEKRQVQYLYTALSMMQVSPMPAVNHRMFIESTEGQIIPVYVEDIIAEEIQQGIKLETTVLLKGYHVYNYSKGPAIVIESVSSN